MSADVAAAGDEASKRRAAQLRSMPLTRMLDYGMDLWDATQLLAAPAREPWHAVATALADAQEERGEGAESRGDVETAVACFRRAVAALNFAQMEFNADGPEKERLYSRLSDLYGRAARLETRLRVERLAIPYRGSSCTGWYVGSPDGSSGPVVVIVGGQSGWGLAYHGLAEALVARGLSALLFEAPGQGLTRMAGGLRLDADSHLAFSAALEAVFEVTGVAGPAGVWGNSLGGLFAARAAVHDDRFAACCVNGAPIHPVAAPFRTAIEQSQALFGVEGADAVSAAFRELWLDPEVDRMAADLLVLHGGADPLVSQEMQEPFLRLAERSSLRVWDDGEHTMYNHSAERTEHVADWMRARLAHR